jgi:hypothetical protein
MADKMTIVPTDAKYVALVNRPTLTRELAVAAPDLLAACEAWARFADELENNADPLDPVTQIRNRIHGRRIAQTRNAITKAKGNA